MKMIKNIFYTQSAKERLEKLHIDIDQEIEIFLREKKYIPGDDYIEVTASDIDELSRRFRIVNSSSSNVKSLITVIYPALGIVVTLIGLFLDQIQNIANNQPERLLIIIFGLSLTFLGWFYSYLIAHKKREDTIRTKFDNQSNMNTQYQVEKKIEKEVDSLNSELGGLTQGKTHVSAFINKKEDIIIHSAKYFHEKNWINVTPVIKELVEKGINEFIVSNDLMGGDPYWNKPKTLEIICTVNGIKKTLSSLEQTTMKIE